MQLNLPFAFSAIDLPPENRSAMADAFGAKAIWKTVGGWLAGTIHTELSSKGISAITVEDGGGCYPKAESIDFLYSGVLRTMQYLGLLKEGARFEKTTVNPVVVRGGGWIRSRRGGIFYAKCQLGDRVHQNQGVGEIRNCFGDLIEEIRAPINGVVIGIKKVPPVETGDWTVLVCEIQE